MNNSTDHVLVAGGTAVLTTPGGRTVTSEGVGDKKLFPGDNLVMLPDMISPQGSDFGSVRLQLTDPSTSLTSIDARDSIEIAPAGTGVIQYTSNSLPVIQRFARFTVNNLSEVKLEISMEGIVLDSTGQLVDRLTNFGTYLFPFKFEHGIDQNNYGPSLRNAGESASDVAAHSTAEIVVMSDALGDAGMGVDGGCIPKATPAGSSLKLWTRITAPDDLRSQKVLDVSWSE